VGATGGLSASAFLLLATHWLTSSQWHPTNQQRQNTSIPRIPAEASRYPGLLSPTPLACERPDPFIAYSARRCPGTPSVVITWQDGESAVNWPARAKLGASGVTVPGLPGRSSKNGARLRGMQPLRRGSRRPSQAANEDWWSRENSRTITVGRNRMGWSAPLPTGKERS